MKIKFLVGVLVLLIVVNLAVIGTFVAMHFSRKPPQPDRWGMRAVAPDGDRQARRHRIMREHREELMVHLHDLREETAPFRERIADLESEVFEALQAEPVSEVVVDSLLGEVSHVQLEMSKAAARKLMEAKEVLPPEHREMFFREMLNARRGHMGMMGDGPPHGRHGRRLKPDSLSR